MSKRLMNPGLALQSLWFATCLPQKNLRSDWLIKLKLSITNLNLYVIYSNMLGSNACWANQLKWLHQKEICCQTYNPLWWSLVCWFPTIHPVKASSSWCRRRFAVPPRSCTKTGTLLSSVSRFPFILTGGQLPNICKSTTHQRWRNLFKKYAVRNSPPISQKSHEWYSHA